MVIDDSLLARKAIENMLGEDPGIEVVVTANNGRDALSKIGSFSPDVVTCDLEMPVMDGVQTLMNLRRDYPDIRVIILSSIAQPDSEKEQLCRNLGAHAVLAKPTEHSNLRVVEKRNELLSAVKQ